MDDKSREFVDEALDVIESLGHLLLKLVRLVEAELDADDKV